ncbi:SdiA-regulated domain-containing protein [Ruixingdingia sedimenti]|uniref:SdiA-regulated domain-containing protein n=1 Tax=Ruixingdingia sedimenti TaxID=3073604 RepID=A0ABU1F4R3_9RHOB|nr:SdiA-regulated domain-containing protein [Xinfangfangia sp. LG-4]MDR5651866.1 SdiA-regulated domain-containing protein [Xinfangfangia sp. LG-4]
MPVDAAIAPLPRRRWRRWLRRAGIAAVLVVLAAVAVHLRVVPFVWYWGMMQLNASDWRDRAIWLPDYRVALDAAPVAGVASNLSGLTYSAETGTLFSVVNRPPLAVELSPDGRLLRTLPIRGAGDPEGITHVAGDRFIVVDEDSQTFTWVRIGPDTAEIVLDGAPRFSLHMDKRDNMGFEGVSWDDRTGRLLIVQEMLPLRVLVVEGLAGLVAGGPMALDIWEWAPSDASRLFMRDLSSITLHEPTGHVLLLSHMSSMVVEYAADGTPVSILPLVRGAAGLSATVPQAEGIAMGPAGEIFVVSEPNLFYRLERTHPAPWMGAGQGG